MSGKYDKVAGVFVIEDLCTDDEKRVYIGKSNSVGGAIRSAKSKLKKGKFHNHSLQNDVREFGISDFKFHEPILLSDGDNLISLHKKIRDEWTDKGYMLHNDICYIDRIENVTTSELSGLTGYEQDFIRLVVDKINKIDIDAFSHQLNNL